MSDSGRHRDTPAKQAGRTRLLLTQAGEAMPGSVPVLNTGDVRCRVPGLRRDGTPKRPVNLEEVKEWLLSTATGLFVPMIGWLTATEPKVLVYGKGPQAASVRWMRATDMPGRTTFTLFTPERVAVAIRQDLGMTVLWHSEIDRFLVAGTNRRARLWLEFPDTSRVAIPMTREETNHIRPPATR